MKVLHTVISGEVAGGQLVCLQLIEALARERHEACVVSPSDGPFVEMLKAKGIPVFLIPFEKTYSFHRAAQLSRLIREEKVDLVHTHGMVPQNVHSRLAAKWAGVPCISHIHIANVFNSNPLIRKYQMFLDAWTSKFCHTLIAVSEETKTSLVKQGIPSSRVHVIANGIHIRENRTVKTREEILRQFNLDPQKRFVGMIGRLCPIKGQATLLEAAAFVKQQMPDVVWMIVGGDIEFDGKYETELRVLAKTLGLNGQAVFTGFQADPLSLLNIFDLFILPSRAEGMPLVILEAMSLKKPVIATSVGGIPEVVEDGKTGILIPPNSPQALADAVTRLLLHPKQAEQMGQAGFERVKKYFDADQTARSVFRLYDEAASR